MRVLIALDSSRFGRAAFESVLSRPWWGDTEFCIINVVQTLAPAFADWGIYSGECISLQEAEKQQAQEFVAQASEELRKSVPNCKVDSVVEKGYIADRIVEKAQSWDANLIILGSHGRSGVAKLLLGSVAEAALHRAPCSVEIVKIHAKEKQPHQYDEKQIEAAVTHASVSTRFP